MLSLVLSPASWSPTASPVSRPAVARSSAIEMRTPLMAGNWKMNTVLPDALALAKEVAAQGNALLADKAAHAQRAAQREAALRAERAQLAMAAAAARREEAINARVRLQARLAPTKESKEAEKDRAEAEEAVLRRRTLFERLNAAE